MEHTYRNITELLGPKLTRQFLDIATEESLWIWFNKPNKVFDNQTPYEVVLNNRNKIEELMYYFKNSVLN